MDEMAFSFSPLLLWLIAGIVLLIGEMVSASFFLVFMSLGSFAAAIAAHLQAPLLYQVLVLLVVSIVGVLTLRKPIQQRLLKKISLPSDIGKILYVDKDLQPHQQEIISYQGSVWSAVNIDTGVISQGSQAIIVTIEGNTLLLKKKL